MSTGRESFEKLHQEYINQFNHFNRVEMKDLSSSDSNDLSSVLEDLDENIDEAMVTLPLFSDALSTVIQKLTQGEILDAADEIESLINHDAILNDHYQIVEKSCKAIDELQFKKSDHINLQSKLLQSVENLFHQYTLPFVRFLIAFVQYEIDDISGEKQSELNKLEKALVELPMPLFHLSLYLESSSEIQNQAEYLQKAQQDYQKVAGLYQTLTSINFQDSMNKHELLGMLIPVSTVLERAKKAHPTLTQAGKMEHKAPQKPLPRTPNLSLFREQLEQGANREFIKLFPKKTSQQDSFKDSFLKPKIDIIENAIKADTDSKSKVILLTAVKELSELYRSTSNRYITTISNNSKQKAVDIVKPIQLIIDINQQIHYLNTHADTAKDGLGQQIYATALEDFSRLKEKVLETALEAQAPLVLEFEKLRKHTHEALDLDDNINSKIEMLQMGRQEEIDTGNQDCYSKAIVQIKTLKAKLAGTEIRPDSLKDVQIKTDTIIEKNKELLNFRKNLKAQMLKIPDYDVKKPEFINTFNYSTYQAVQAVYNKAVPGSSPEKIKELAQEADLIFFHAAKNLMALNNILTIQNDIKNLIITSKAAALRPFTEAMLSSIKNQARSITPETSQDILEPIVLKVISTANAVIRSTTAAAPYLRLVDEMTHFLGKINKPANKISQELGAALDQSVRQFGEIISKQNFSALPEEITFLKNALETAAHSPKKAGLTQFNTAFVQDEVIEFLEKPLVQQIFQTAEKTQAQANKQTRE